MSDPVLVSRDGAIATVTLNNPERLNALAKPMWRRLGEVMRELSADDALRCVVLRGAGDKAFAAGADISEFATERADSRQAKDVRQPDPRDDAVGRALPASDGGAHPGRVHRRRARDRGDVRHARRRRVEQVRRAGQPARLPVNRLGLTMGYGELPACSRSSAGP